MTRDKDIGKILRSRRLELGMTQEQVALKLGMSIHQYQRYEYGEHRFPSATCLSSTRLSYCRSAKTNKTAKSAFRYYQRADLLFCQNVTHVH